MEAHRQIVLQGVGLSPARLGFLADAIGCPRMAPVGDDAEVLFCFQGTLPDDFEECLARPRFACVEVFEGQDGLALGALRQAVQADLCLSVSTSTAYSQPVARALTVGIAGRIALTTAQREGVELAIQEAVGNAVVHGNLMLESFATSAERLVTFSAAVANRLSDRTYAHRRVHLLARFGHDRMIIEVADEGIGYQPEPVRAAGVFGRGLQLIGIFASSVELLDGGRRIRMCFAL